MVKRCHMPGADVEAPRPRRRIGQLRPLRRAASCQVVGLLLISAGAPSHAALAGVQAGTVAQIEVPSTALHAMRKVIIYLPPGYDDPATASQRYPVLYLLSGAPGSQRDWFRHAHPDRVVDALIAAHAIQPVILVSPDGNGGAYRDTQFIDSFNGRERVETFISHDLITYVDTFYRTIPTTQGRALLGYSAGAYGALNIGLHHPDRFGTLAGFCGYYTADPTEVTRPAINNPFGNDPAVLAYNSPSRTVLSLSTGKRPHIFLFDTTDDGRYTATTRAFDALLTRVHYPHLTKLYTPGTPAQRAAWPHSWTFVAHAFDHYLPAIAATLIGGKP